MHRRLALVAGLLRSATLMRRCAYEVEAALASRDPERIRAAAESAMWTLRGGACLRDAVADLTREESFSPRKNVVDG